MMKSLISRIIILVVAVVLAVALTEKFLSPKEQAAETEKTEPKTQTVALSVKEPKAQMQDAPPPHPSKSTVETPARTTADDTRAAQKAPIDNEIDPDDEPTIIVAAARDTQRPLEERQRMITEISQRKDAEALDVLKQVAEARVYLNFAAVEAMGNFRESPQHPAAAAYVRSRMSDPDSKIACAATRAFARLEGADAIPELGMTIEENRERPDGHDEIVCTTTLEALRDICSPSSAPILIEELERSEERGWNLEYGSTVLSALRVAQTEEGRKAAAAYAERLSDRIPEDKMARAYFEKKIAEAQNIAQLNEEK